MLRKEGYASGLKGIENVIQMNISRQMDMNRTFKWIEYRIVKKEKSKEDVTKVRIRNLISNGKEFLISRRLKDSQERSTKGNI